MAFQGGGAPYALDSLDVFNDAPDVSNWVTAGNAMNTLAAKRFRLAAPAGAPWSMYADWEQDGGWNGETLAIVAASCQTGWPP